MTTTELAFEGVSQGACRTPDPVYGYDLHFPVSENAGSARQIARAKAVCASCPVLAACREYALASGDAGIWGGMTDSERRKVRAREQQRQRELETTQACDVDEPADEQLDDEPAEQQATLPSYQTARDRLTRAHRVLDRACDTGDDAAIKAAQAKVTAARQQLDAVRDRQQTDRGRAYQAARNQLARARRRLKVVQRTGDQDAIREVEQRIATAKQRLEAAKVGNEQLAHQLADEAVA